MAKPALPSLRSLSDFQETDWSIHQAHLRREAEQDLAKLTRMVGKDCRLVPLAEITATSPGQSREKAFDAEHDEGDRGLAESIREIGLIQPVVLVRPSDGASYRVLAGHRRVEAMRYLGYAQILALVIPEDTPELAFVTLAENTRKDLASIERWKAVEYLRGLGFSVDAIAQKTGNTPRSIYKLLEIGALSLEARLEVSQHSLDVWVAAAIGKAPAGFQQELAQVVVQSSLTRQQTEALAEGIKARIVTGGVTAVNVGQLAAELRAAPPASVRPAGALDVPPESAAPPVSHGRPDPKTKALTDRAARDLLQGYFPALALNEVSALAAEAAKRRLPDRVLRLAGMCVVSGRHRPAEAL